MDWVFFDWVFLIEYFLIKYFLIKYFADTQSMGPKLNVFCSISVLETTQVATANLYVRKAVYLENGPGITIPNIDILSRTVSKLSQNIIQMLVTLRFQSLLGTSYSC